MGFKRIRKKYTDKAVLFVSAGETAILLDELEAYVA